MIGVLDTHWNISHLRGHCCVVVHHSDRCFLCPELQECLENVKNKHLIVNIQKRPIAKASEFKRSLDSFGGQKYIFYLCSNAFSRHGFNFKILLSIKLN